MHDLPIETAGASVRVLAQGVDDDNPAEVAAAITGLSIVPPAPVHLGVEDLPDGTAEIRWMRRSRIGWDWTDGIDAPLGEEGERYRATIELGDGPQIMETGESRLVLTAAERLTAVTISVRQVGSHGLSSPTTLGLI